ncbi:MAG TPA: tetratricopeptide repeat protein [Vicinamibacterales bacterium]
MPSRIEDLERRVRQDPSSIAFGALAEEYRRAGRLEEAIAACRAGLERHPSYLSARVTLGRALQEIGDTGDARAEFSYVLSLAPDNLAAIRGLAELHGANGAGSAAHAAPAPVSVPQPVPVRISAPQPVSEPAPPPAAPVAGSDAPSYPPPYPSPYPPPYPPSHPSPDPDLAALDASIERAESSSSAAAEREAQIERLEIWLARLEQAREP